MKYSSNSSATFLLSKNFSTAKSFDNSMASSEERVLHSENIGMPQEPLDSVVSPSAYSETTSFIANKPTFLGLPREVRDMIYEYCLVVNYELNPHPTDYEQYEMQRPLPRKPDVALLKTNKQIHDEAAIVLYGKNIWRVSHQSNIAVKHQIWRNVSLFRHVVVSFDFRDLHSSQLLEISRAVHKSGRTIETEAEEAFVSAMIHADRRYDLESPWMAKARWVGEMHLKTIVLDFSNAYCPSGCCRAHMTNDTVRLLHRAWKGGRMMIGLPPGTSVGLQGKDMPAGEGCAVHAELIGLDNEVAKMKLANTWGLIMK